MALMVGTYIHCLIQTEQIDKVRPERVFRGEANFDSLAIRWSAPSLFHGDFMRRRKSDTTNAP